MTAEHPPPTNSTVKKLYHHAVRCAFPGCANPLYKKDEVSGELILNSHVCHINARREGGPRWDATQSAERNRSADNLLLMCVEHAGAIDDLATISYYPVELLRDWKTAQIAEHEQMQAGWMISDEDAAIAAAASFKPADVSIRNSTLNLGGQGGQSPGAGGGGGGALGSNARAGRGGRGGDIVNHTPEHAPPPDWIDRLVDGVPDGAPPPGSGGGGAGAFGDAAQGGDGGDGGDLAVGFFDLTSPKLRDLDHIEVEVGDAGKPSRLPGQHSGTGGDSVLRFVGKDGTILKTITAKGGGTRRELPDDLIELSRSDLQAGFRVTTLMPANAAESRDGMLYLLGGAWTNLAVPALPCDFVCHVICAVQWGELDARYSRAFYLTLHRPDQAELARVEVRLSNEALKQPGNWHWILPIGAQAEHEGLWSLALRTSDLILAQYDFSVFIPA